MTQTRSKRGRPTGTLGPVATMVREALARSPMTASQVARELKLTVMVARYTCSRLEASGAIRIVAYVKLAEAHKPVSVYEAVEAAEPKPLVPAWVSSARVGVP
ncbi:hypothetical protein G6F59_018439 [Rhizopus arrhizus]|nr:hypothetical protein G6F59_018439 [Rhizopus arrhizus]